MAEASETDYTLTRLREVDLLEAAKDDLMVGLTDRNAISSTLRKRSDGGRL